MQVLKLFPLSALITLTVACGSAVNAASSGANSSSTSASSHVGTSNSFSEIAFSGTHGMHEVNGDKLVVKNGQLRINGVPYGPVNPTSLVKYTVRDNKKTLMVDGVVREPQRAN